jgi:hypothetical protein
MLVVAFIAFIAFIAFVAARIGDHSYVLVEDGGQS